MLKRLFYFPTYLIHRYFRCRKGIHNSVVVQKFSKDSKRLICIYCGKSVLYNSKLQKAIKWEEVDIEAVEKHFNTKINKPEKELLAALRRL